MTHPTDPSSSQSASPLPQLAYDIAFFILPYYAFNRIEKVDEFYETYKTNAGACFYFAAAQAAEVTFNQEDAKLFQWHRCVIQDTWPCDVLQFPTPAPIDLKNSSLKTNEESSLVLSPYFCAIVRESTQSEPHVLILAQNPLGETSIRSVSKTGVNANLGTGPQPNLDAFLDAITRIIQN